MTFVNVFNKINAVMKMYQGHNKTACLSQQAISEAFLRLLEEESFDEISVSEICKEAGVSRQTYYSLFGKKENILLYEISRHYPFRTCEKDCSPRHLSSQICDYLDENARFIQLLIDHDSGNLLYTTFYESFCHIENEYVASFMAGGMSSIIQKFVEKGTSRAEVEEIIAQIFIDAK